MVYLPNKCKTCSRIHHVANIIGSDFMCQMTQNAENGYSRQQRCECVQRGDDRRISIHIVIEFIERRVHNQITKAHSQREEALRYCRVPHLREKAKITILKSRQT